MYLDIPDDPKDDGETANHRDCCYCWSLIPCPVRIDTRTNYSESDKSQNNFDHDYEGCNRSGFKECQSEKVDRQYDYEGTYDNC
ncbi:hypothetical protein SAMN05216388_10573 [Halorientalis persicus]|uniref:Uncharacterized protein n=1 Tax=Halorientalis persicus TaxID=1367881 RepID=A0A1H8WEV0_9EURY|nr:hypothetical protein SAMN05216388_10573 [Halorientalis persicus]